MFGQCGDPPPKVGTWLYSLMTAVWPLAALLTSLSLCSQTLPMYRMQESWIMDCALKKLTVWLVEERHPHSAELPTPHVVLHSSLPSLDPSF